MTASSKSIATLSRSEPAKGSRRAGGAIRFSFDFDEEMAAELRARASAQGISLNELVRTYCQWGLDEESKPAS